MKKIIRPVVRERGGWVVEKSLLLLFHGGNTEPEPVVPTDGGGYPHEDFLQAPSYRNWLAYGVDGLGGTSASSVVAQHRADGVNADVVSGVGSESLSRTMNASGLVSENAVGAAVASPAPVIVHVDVVPTKAFSERSFGAGIIKTDPRLVSMKHHGSGRVRDYVKGQSDPQWFSPAEDAELLLVLSPFIDDISLALLAEGEGR